MPNFSRKIAEAMEANPQKAYVGIKVGTATLATYTYARPDGLMTQMKYGNNHVVNYTYDALERPATVKYNDGTKFTYTYNGLGGLGKLNDSRGRDYVYNYDSLGRLISMREFKDNKIIQSMSSDYDSSNRVSKLSYRVSPDYSGTFNDARIYDYTYNNADGTLTKLTGPGGRLAYDYDNLNRLRYKNTYDAASGGNVVVGRQYGYLAGSGTNVSSNLVGSLTLKNGNTTYSTASYQYDALGNITTITATINGTAQNRSYTYDEQGQMLTETRDGTTYYYKYDTYGNIWSKGTRVGTTDTETASYTYETSGWLDKLTNYNGTDISYDGAGNPTTWPRITSLTWNNGKQLTAAKVGSKNLTFTYDVDGLRLTKYDGSYTHNYIWQGDRLVSEHYNGKALEFFYDASGTPYAFEYDDVMYYYITNLQGDVIAITDSAGAIVASYKYDAWGKLVSDAPAANSIGAINPLRYRGYYFDTETGLYYLQSRYYDPEVCRFINADEAGNLAANGDYVSYNLFAYCGNDPISRIDPTGQAWWHWALGAAVVALCAVATVATCGGFAAAAMAVGMVGSGVAATTAASTVAAAAFIGSATIYGASALTAASSSDSVQEFFDQGNWGTVAATAGGAAFGAYNGYVLSGSQSSQSVTASNSPSGGSHTSGTGSPKKILTLAGHILKRIVPEICTHIPNSTNRVAKL